jgi:hypothetical protein
VFLDSYFERIARIGKFEVISGRDGFIELCSRPRSRTIPMTVAARNGRGSIKRWY